MSAVSRAGRKTSFSGVAAIVAIPACNEADRVPRCLAALAAQRDLFGAPLRDGRFGILVYANNCTDETAAVCRQLAAAIPHPLRAIEDVLPHEHANAGWARKRAMDLAAEILIAGGQHDGCILTTDADTAVAPTWVDATLRCFAAGADGVAGYVDGMPDELLHLGPAFLNRGRLEDAYLRLVAELYSLCDPRPHDPWPNHRVSSGASLAVRLPAYLAIGGLPPLPLGEDAALTEALDDAGFKVRHALDVLVATSCRFDSRARGGAGDTMRLRHTDPDAFCDADLEPILAIARRALWRGRLRSFFERGGLDADRTWSARLKLNDKALKEALVHVGRSGFGAFWQAVQSSSPVLAPKAPLRPSELARETARAEAVIARLREVGAGRPGVQDDKRRHAAGRGTAAA